MQTQRLLCSLGARASGGPLAVRARYDNLTLDGEALQALIHSEPETAATLLLTLARDLAERLQIASRELALRSADS